MFEKISTPELERVVEQLSGSEFAVSRSLVQNELSRRALAHNVKIGRDEALEAIRNDITGIYDAMDGTVGAPEHPEDVRWA